MWQNDLTVPGRSLKALTQYRQQSKVILSCYKIKRPFLSKFNYYQSYQLNSQRKETFNRRNFVKNKKSWYFFFVNDFTLRTCQIRCVMERIFILWKIQYNWSKFHIKTNQLLHNKKVFSFYEFNIWEMRSWTWRGHPKMSRSIKTVFLNSRR